MAIIQRMAKWSLLAVVFVGCNLPEHIAVDPQYLVPGPDGWEAAADVITTDFHTNRPTIYWYGPAGLNCGGGLGFLDDDGYCLNGWTGINAILLALPRPSSQRPSETGLAHELAHHRWIDEGHGSVEIWGADKHDGPGSRVGDVNARLAELGL